MSSSFSVAPPLDPALRWRLSLMMFLQYAIWGAWLPILWPYLAGHRDLEPGQIGNIFACGAAGALLAPFVAGQIADRWFATERFLALSHLLGALLIWQLASLETYNEFRIFSLLYSLVYSPTLALTNSLALHHLPDRDRDFGGIRLWGTLGWIAVGIGMGQWLLVQHTPLDAAPAAVQAAQDAGRADAFRLSAILGGVMGIFCLFLPHTPPAREVRGNASLAALRAVGRSPSLRLLFLLAVPMSCVHQFYFVHTAGFLSKFQTDAGDAINRVLGVGGGGLMTIGQVSEIAVLALIPFLARGFSRKTLLAVGIAAYAARMAIFASTESVPLLMLGVALHGLCFGCFVFVAFMIVDEETDADVRASAQSLFTLVIFGIGIIAGSKIAGDVAEWATTDGALDFTRLFSVPMWGALACLAVLLSFYPGKRRTSGE